MNETIKRRWFHFSIRDLLLVTVIVALAVGWWIDHRRLAVDREEYEYLQFATKQYQQYIRKLPLSDSPTPTPNP
jgi:hypothetical protein